jgi:pimeloyl-ACP methyl ester carboxylesterase
MIALKFISLHPDRAISGTLGGMGMMKEGGFMQKIWEDMLGKGKDGLVPAACIRGFGKFALSESELKAVKTPLCVLVGDQDPCRQLYVEPLHQMREDIPIVKIQDAGHLTCVAKPQFKDEVKKWIDKNAGK